jgi:hypothetical protein
MDIWIGRINKVMTSQEPIICDYCHQGFQLGEIIVFGRIIYRGSNRKIVGRKNLHWHSKLADGSSCYIEQGIAATALHPYIENRGGKRLLLDSDTRHKRLQLLQRRAHLIQELQWQMECMATGEDVVDKIVSIGEKLEMLKEAIANYGGVPKSWQMDSAKEDLNECPVCTETVSQTS